MLPWRTLDRARAPDGAELVLQERNGEVVIRADGRELMSSRAHGSEETMAELGCARLRPDARVLVGGLGLGYTLRATLERLGRGARAVVAELVPAVVEWNRGPLAHLAGRPLDDPRVTVEVGDVRDVLARAPGGFDAVLLDVDNGPAALVRPANRRLYERAGIRLATRALRPGGVLVLWSASPDGPFERRARAAGLDVSAHEVPARGPGHRGPTHTLYLLRAR